MRGRKERERERERAFESGAASIVHKIMTTHIDLAYDLARTAAANWMNTLLREL